MDLVTLVTACALGVEPKLMHALVWHQSGGDPWSFSVPGESDRRTYATIRDAIREARTLHPHGGTIRVGLAGVPMAPSSVVVAPFIPCVNITIAARQIVQLTKRCTKSAGLPTDPMSCAIAAYHGSWDRPDAAFAEAVTASGAKGDAPNFDLPNDIDSVFTGVATDWPPGSTARTSSRIRDCVRRLHACLVERIVPGKAGAVGQRIGRRSK